MSVLNKGMKMPKNCAECRLWDTCEYMQDFDDWISIYEAVEDGDLVRDKNCPLSEVPTPHGRMIDVDAVNRKMDERVETLKDDASMYEASCVATALEMFAPTVIEAEE